MGSFSAIERSSLLKYFDVWYVTEDAAEMADRSTREWMGLCLMQFMYCHGRCVNLGLLSQGSYRLV